ncbi:MAG: hypothetical protein Q8P41_09955 [Pseudomonadota bacterium]|nr:hypothetical protein [Pseudomonadota bacterium]
MSDLLYVGLPSHARLAPQRLALLATIGLFVGWPLVPDDSFLARHDLVPWVALCTTVVVAILGGRLDSGPHPQLTALTSTTGRNALRLAAAAGPWLVVLLIDMGAALGEAPDAPGGSLAELRRLGLASVGLAAAMTALAWVGRDEGRTAWRPPTTVTPLRRVLRVLWAVAACLVPLLIGAATDLAPGRWPAVACVAGLGFLLCTQVWRRDQDEAQRARTSHRVGDERRGSTGRLPWTTTALAIAIPALGVAALQALAGCDTPNPSGVEFYLAVAGFIVWPVARPRGLGCVLHEVVPVSETKGAAPTEDADRAPPSGTLRFRPLHVRRTGLSIPWIVPATGRLDPSASRAPRLLWPAPAPPSDVHVVGDARLDRVRSAVSLSEVIVPVKGEGDIASLGPTDNAGRRLLVYEPRTRARRPSTWRWDRPADDQILSVDATTEELRLTDGSVVLLSSGLVTVLWEVEVGEVLLAGDAGAFDHAVPQIQDYVKP